VRRVLLVIILGLAVACTTGHTITPVNRTVVDIRATVKNLWGTAPQSSQNEREIISGPLKIDPADKTPPNQLKIRAYARVVIIGERRPYEVLVEAYVEKKDERGVFHELGMSEGLSRELGTELRKALIESRENWNVIDDFRAF
jgi:hypothetical protein